MKKMLPIMLVLIVVYYVIQYLFTLGGYSLETNYTIKVNGKDIQIYEKLAINEKDTQDNYYFEIKNDNATIAIQSYDLLKKKEHAIIDIKEVTADNYSCIFPVFTGNKVLTDILCYQNGVTYNYHDIAGKSKTIDDFANGISEYFAYEYKDNIKNPQTKELLIVYPDNIIEDYNIVISNYRGFVTTDTKYTKSIKEYEMFQNDVYKKPLTVAINKYYLIADYDKTYDFNTFHLINYESFKAEKIVSDTSISFNSYFQGIYKNSAYLIDCENKVQYEINTKTKKITQIGNVSNGALDYENDKLVNRPINELINSKKTFEYYKTDYQNNAYVKIDRVGSGNSGFYYLYKKNGDNYDIYKANVQNPNLITHIFTTDEINQIKYVSDVVYYFKDNSIKSYSDRNGLKTIVNSDDYQFNQDIFYHVYR